jgi:hypothetical protein
MCAGEEKCSCPVRFGFVFHNNSLLFPINFTNFLQLCRHAPAVIKPLFDLNVRLHCQVAPHVVSIFPNHTHQNSFVLAKVLLLQHGNRKGQDHHRFVEILTPFFVFFTFLRPSICNFPCPLPGITLAGSG